MAYYAKNYEEGVDVGLKLLKDIDKKYPERIERVDNYINWCLKGFRMDKKTGQLHFFPKLEGQGEAIYPFIGAEGIYLSRLNKGYPHGFKFDYECGYKNSDFVPHDIRNFIIYLFQ